MSDDTNDIGIVNRDTKPLLNEQILAELIDRSARSLQADRQRGTGIPYIKVGRSVRYDPTVVEQYLRAQTRVSTSQTEAHCAGENVRVDGFKNHTNSTQRLSDLDAARSAVKAAIIDAGLLNAVDRTRVNTVIRLLDLEKA